MGASQTATGAPSEAGGLTDTERPFWRRTWLVVLVLVIAVFIAFVIRQGASTFYYVVMAWFAALAMEPLVGRLARRMKRGLATGIVMLGVGAFLAGFLAIFGNLFVEQLVALISSVPNMAADALEWVNKSTGSSYTYESLLESLGISSGDIADYADDVALGVLSMLSSIVSGAFGVFVLVFFIFYVSAGMPALRRWLAQRMSPTVQVPFLAAWDITGTKVGSYIAARVFLAALNATFSGIAFALLGLPYWLPLALWTGLVAQFIPNVGTYISIALPVLVGLTSDKPLVGVWVLVWAVAYQQVENILIEPRISARAVNLHPAVSFGAALLGAQLFGLSGALLGVPVAATTMAMLEIYKRRYELTPETEARVASLVGARQKQADEADEAEEPPEAADAESQPPPTGRPSASS